MNRMIAAIYIIITAIFAFGIYEGSKYLLHMAQLEGYKPRQYWWWIKHNLNSLLSKDFIMLLVALAFFVIARVKEYSGIIVYAISFLWIDVYGFLAYQSLNRKKDVKKPLVFTHRAIRLFIINLLLVALWTVLSYISLKDSAGFLLALSLIKLLLPFNMLLSTAVAYPMELLVQYRYFRLAGIKIRGMKDLKVIGITGSYGKTSTKYFLKTILSEKYNTLMTPESYNTPMGITRVIREQLTDEHEVFVCEMGARNIGDIKTLCNLTGPSMGILTSIGPQHLETFKSIENVAKTKNELIEALTFDGTAIFNGDSELCLELARKTGVETFIYSINNIEKDTYLHAEEIRNSREGLKFRVKGQDGIDFECQAPILGKHNVSNMLAAICAALKLNLTTEEIKRGVSNIKPVPHRLEILPTQNGVTVIDDAFNSNPVGAREALETIKEFADGSRIVITPGMVELGRIEYEENKKFGKIMAKCVDYAILVGIKRSKPILEGLRSEGFKEDRIIVVSSLSEATQKMGAIIKAGDVVLFENDLPDNYNE